MERKYVKTLSFLTTSPGWRMAEEEGNLFGELFATRYYDIVGAFGSA